MTPVTCDIASSMGLMMPVSTSSGDAPGHETLTVTVGLSTSGNWLTPMRETAMMPKRIVPAMIIHAKTGLPEAESVMFTAPPSGRWPPRRRPRAGSRGGRARGRGRRAAAASPASGACGVERRAVGDLHGRALAERLEAAHDEQLAGGRAPA